MTPKPGVDVDNVIVLSAVRQVRDLESRRRAWLVGHPSVAGQQPPDNDGDNAGGMA